MGPYDDAAKRRAKEAYDNKYTEVIKLGYSQECAVCEAKASYADAYDTFWDDVEEE